MALSGKQPTTWVKSGHGPPRVLGGIAPISHSTDGPPGQLLGDEIKESTGQLTSGTLGHGERFGLVRLEMEGAANRHAEAVVKPLLVRQAHDTQHKVQAPQRPVFLPG